MQVTQPNAQSRTESVEISVASSVASSVAHPLSACVLAIESSTTSLSVALAHREQVRHWQGAGGALASSQIIDQIKKVLVSASIDIEAIDVIAFGCGPGAFTGLRTACSVTQGLAFAAKKPVLPLSGLLALAEAARGAFGAHQVIALLDARMGEVYWAAYEWQAEQGEWRAVVPPCASAPQQLALPSGFDGWVAAGAAWPVFAAQFAPELARYTHWLDALPQAEHLLAPARRAFARGEAVAAEHANLLYVRDHVAQTISERSAAAQQRASEQTQTQDQTPKLSQA